jgi:uncharacterized protein YkwD
VPLHSRSLAAAAAGVGLLACLHAPPASAAVTVKANSPDAVLERVFQLVNAARSGARRCGRRGVGSAPPLRPSRALTLAAQDHAHDMVRRRYFDHAGSDGSAPKERVRRRGYEPRLTGENIAYGPESAEEVVAGWLRSPGHCENIMDARFHDTGLALDVDRRSGAVYWVEDFGTKLRTE